MWRMASIKGFIGARNRYVANEPISRQTKACDSLDGSQPERTLLVLKITEDIKAGAVSDVLHEHAAVAVKDASGQWRFSPYRNAARV